MEDGRFQFSIKRIRHHRAAASYVTLVENGSTAGAAPGAETGAPEEGRATGKSPGPAGRNACATVEALRMPAPASQSRVRMGQMFRVVPRSSAWFRLKKYFFNHNLERMDTIMGWHNMSLLTVLGNIVDGSLWDEMRCI